MQMISPLTINAQPLINSNGAGETFAMEMPEGIQGVTDVDGNDADTADTLNYSLAGWYGYGAIPD